MNYDAIPATYVNKLAKNNGVKYRGRERSEVISELIEKGHQNKLEYLSSNFEYISSYFTLCQTEKPFPDSARTSQDFVRKLVEQKWIKKEQIGETWKPKLKEEIQISGVQVDGTTVYLRLVEGKKRFIKNNYDTVATMYPKFTVILIHFNPEEPSIELRCSLTDQDKYMDFIMKVMGFGLPCKWHAIPKLTKKMAQSLYTTLSAGIAARHINIPSNVGSVKFSGKKGINLDEDATFAQMIQSFNEHDIPTDDTMDETCFFVFKDPLTEMEFEAYINVDIRNSLFKFAHQVPEFVIRHVLEAVYMTILANDPKVQLDRAVGEQ